MIKSGAVWASIAIIALYVTSAGCQKGDIQEYCEDESFTATCPDQSVVMITRAVYGRMRKGRCLTRDDTLGCRADVRVLVARRCTGRSSCTVMVTSLINDGTMPCSRDFRSFLEAGYTCVPVLRGESTDCTQGSSIVSVTGTGYISNYVAFMSGCGSSNHPWLLHAGPGQRINLTLIDNVMSPTQPGTKNLPGGGPSSAVGDGGHTCSVYAVIREPSGGQTRTICGGVGVQEAEVYLSLNSSVEIRVIGRKKSEEDDNNFLLMYQVIGCRDPVVSPGTWFRRDDHEAILGCDGSRKQWSMRCLNGVWTGADKNAQLTQCPEEMKVSMLGSAELPTLFKGLSVLVIIAVAVSVGVTILLAGLVYLKRRRSRHAADRSRVEAARYGGKPSQQSLGVSTSQRSKEGKDLMYNMTNNDCHLINSWQQQHGHHIGEDPVFSRAIRQQDLPYNFPENVSTRYHPAMEHLYESPKFDRKDLMTSPTETMVGITSYDGRLPPDGQYTHSMHPECI